MGEGPDVHKFSTKGSYGVHNLCTGDFFSRAKPVLASDSRQVEKKSVRIVLICRTFPK